MNEEKMELEILKLIFDYSKTGHFPDHYFLDKVVEIVVKKRDLNDYVKKTVFIDKLGGAESDKTCASYNYLRKQISVYYWPIQIMCQENSCYDSLFNPIERILYHNINITQCILHELEHAMQHKTADDYKNTSMEAKLIRTASLLNRTLKNPKFNELLLSGKISTKELEIYLKDYENLYNEYYEINPMERMAQINSYRTIINCLESIKKQIPMLFTFNHAALEAEKISGYESSWQEGLCPTHAYLKNTRKEDVWKSFDFYDENKAVLIKKVSNEYDLNKRLLLGLPVSPDECGAHKIF